MTDPTCPDVLAQARAALRDVVSSLVTLVRSVPDANSVAVGTWTVGDVAAHLSHVFRFDTDAIAGKPVPEAIVTPAGMAEVNAKMLAEDGERDPAVLADRIGALANEFDDLASRSSPASLGARGRYSVTTLCSRSRAPCFRLSRLCRPPLS